jgi:hypothetical protein
MQFKRRMNKYGRFYEVPSTSMLADELRFLSRAVADDDTRYFMECIKIEEDFKAISVDGRRIHIVKKLHDAAQKVHEIVPGNYTVKKTAGKYLWLVKIESDMGQFPDYMKVIPDGTPDWTGECDGLDWKKNGSRLVELFYSFPEPTSINIQYLADLGDHHFKVQWRKPKTVNGFSLVTFESDTRLAVIAADADQRGNHHQQA